MSKAFVREDVDDSEDDTESGPALPVGSKNYITPGGFQRLKAELIWLLNKERPAVTSAVSWAAKNGDRSENADYQYGKKRLREIDRRIRFLSKRLDIAEVVDPAAARDAEAASKVFFGATVTYSNHAGQCFTVAIVGIDELDLARGHITWISPVARVLMKTAVGDSVVLRAPGGTDQLEVLDVRYEALDCAPFVPIAPTGVGSSPSTAN